MLIDVPGGTETEDVFHYTSAEPGILILQGLRLRLGSFETMNDLREARQNTPGFMAHEDDAASVTNGLTAMQLMRDMDWYLRRFVKIACFTRDFDPLPGSFDETGLRGWAHPALWAHYGAAHSGMCLRFNRPRLIEAVSAQHSDSGRVYAGNVLYPPDPLPVPSTIDAGQIKEFGLDAAVLDYMDAMRDDLLFTKNVDWAAEQEFRLLLIGADLAPTWLDVSECLTGVYFGESFSPSRLDVAQELLRDRSNVESFKLGYFNRRFIAGPSGTGSRPPDVTARRPGSLDERLRELTAVRTERRVAQDGARQRIQPIVVALRERAAQLSIELAVHSGVEFHIHPQVTAIPPARRQRAAGVPGEVIDHQTGVLVTANVSLGEHTAHEYSASIGLSMLSSGEVRLDGLVTRRAIQVWEDWGGDVELWRGGPIEVPFDQCGAAAAGLMEQVAQNSIARLDMFTGPLRLIAAARSTDTPGTLSCPQCGRPMEPVERGGVVEWKCGYSEHTVESAEQ